MQKASVVFVTGADHGLGRAMAEAFARRGLKVFAGVHSEAGLRDERFRELGIVTVPLDVTRDESVRAAAEQLRQQAGRLDLLVNNAGRLGDIETDITKPIDFDDVLATLNVNAVGPLRVLNAVVDLLRQGELRTVLNISSEAGSIGACWRQGWYGYTMSKAALNMQTVVSQNRLREEGIRLLLVHPGYLKTFMHGAKNQKAELEPEEVAGHICEMALAPAREGERKTVPYVDWSGKTLPW